MWKLSGDGHGSRSLLDSSKAEIGTYSQVIKDTDVSRALSSQGA